MFGTNNVDFDGLGELQNDGMTWTAQNSGYYLFQASLGFMQSYLGQTEAMAINIIGVGSLSIYYALQPFNESGSFGGNRVISSTIIAYVAAGQSVRVSVSRFGGNHKIFNSFISYFCGHLLSV